MSDEVILSGDDILAKDDDLPTEKLLIPEWKGAVFVRSMTAAERDDFETTVMSSKGKGRNLGNVRARLAVRVLVNAKGERLFQDGDAPSLGRRSAKALDRIFEAAQRLNGMSDKDVDDLEKNSG